MELNLQKHTFYASSAHIQSIEYTWQEPYIIVSLTLRVKCLHKYFRHETALYHRRGRRQDNRRVTSAAVVYAIERLVRYYMLPNASRIRRRAEIKASRIFERNMNVECQRQLHTVEEARV
ncbi:Peramine synthetase ppzA [Trichinella spiralis]|uniref:Peramine synthetase ppzA n=1 Tax=Trichinella spiralis TaxID=6334 RepID=A0ABR3KTX6_TRISP